MLGSGTPLRSVTIQRPAQLSMFRPACVGWMASSRRCRSSVFFSRARIGLKPHLVSLKHGPRCSRSAARRTRRCDHPACSCRHLFVLDIADPPRSVHQPSRKRQLRPRLQRILRLQQSRKHMSLLELPLDSALSSPSSSPLVAPKCMRLFESHQSPSRHLRGGTLRTL